MKKYLLPALIVLLSFSTARSQTQITIIGSPHRETGQFKKKDLYHAIDLIKPDLILVELDSGQLAKDFSIPQTLRPYFEMAVVDSFIKKNPNTHLRPFDYEGRNKFFIENHYFNDEANFFGGLSRLYRKDSLSFTNHLIQEAALNYSGIADRFSETSLETINSSQVDAIIEIKMKWYYKYFNRIIATTPPLIKYSAHFKLDSVFWIKRNNQMAQHIINFSKRYTGKKIVVITGNSHRYFLKELLVPDARKYGFKITEFYEIAL
jgi:hypothetical protein